MKKMLIAFALALPGYLQAQEAISGSVFSAATNAPLPGAWIKVEPSGKTMLSDENGLFSFLPDSTDRLIILGYIGYKTDTLQISPDVHAITIILQPTANITTVVVKGNTDATYISGINTAKVQVMTEKELGKAACCNLSESFETNPSVDVNYNDAVTGTKQIQMLGLSGVYSPVQLENIPFSRGLAANTGLGFIPGQWVESIQVSKGAGSVVNGFESTAGLINVELKKPETAEKLYINGYINSMLRSEANLNYAVKLNDKWSTGFLTHFDGWQSKVDLNKDGFMDMPMSSNYGIVNRWKYQGTNGFESMFGVKAFYDRRTGGQLNYDAKAGNQPGIWGFDMQTKRAEVFAKNGYVFPNKEGHSIGTIISAIYHKQNNVFGFRSLNMSQASIYANFIYQGRIINEKHSFKTGLSFMYDNIDEQFMGIYYQRAEVVPGAFYEYTYNAGAPFSAVAGIRADYNNLFGLFFTPRLHLKYSISELVVLRASAGRGQRTANIFAENLGLLANNRQWLIPGFSAYGLQPEVAWNYGVNLTWGFFIKEREATLSIDLYRTDFTNQVVIDMDQSAQRVAFYNLVGPSYSNSAQAQFDYKPIDGLELRLAYRYYDVKTQYGNTVLPKPFVAKHRAFVNIGYNTPSDNWRFDLTAQWFGAKRIPVTSTNPVDYQMPAMSPSFFIFNAQVTRVIKKWEVYIGGENLGNFRQNQLIIDYNNIDSQYFDASLVWGPTIGRMFYAGFRFKLG